MALQLTPSQISSMGEDRGPTVTIVSSILVALSTASVVLRFISRMNRRVGFGMDDWLSIGALVFLILFCVTCIISVPYGMGRHVWAADPAIAWKILQIGYFNALIYVAVHWFIKMSILAFYRRVFTLNVTWFKYAVYGTAVYTSGWFVGCFFGAMFQCFPPAYFWQQYNQSLGTPLEGSCGVNNAALVISSAALNTAGDIAVFALPIAMLAQLNLRRSHKVALIALFTTGAFAIAAGIVRLYRSLGAIKLNADTTWITADIYLWTAIEAAVGLICSCLPITRPLLGLAKDRVSSYLSDWRQSKTLQGTTSHSHKRTPTTGDIPSGITNCENSRSTSHLQPQSQTHQGIMRTDEYILESYSRTERPSSDNNFNPGVEIHANNQV